MGLRPRTIELYQRLLARHITPHLGNVAVASSTPDMIRNWRFTLLAAGVSESAAAKAYRLLRAVLATAADDRVIARNPCRIRGAGDEKPAERPVLTVAQVFDLADRIRNPRYKALILLATVAIPAPITAVLTAHLDPYVDQEPTALIVDLTHGTQPSRAARSLVRYARSYRATCRSPRHYAPGRLGLYDDCQARWWQPGGSPGMFGWPLLRITRGGGCLLAGQRGTVVPGGTATDPTGWRVGSMAACPEMLRGCC